MAAEAVTASIREILAAPGLAARGEAFGQTFGTRFDSFFDDLDHAIATLRRESWPLKLNLLDSLPQPLVSQLDALDPATRGALAKEIVRRSLMRLPECLAASRLPASVLDLYPGTLTYMVRSLLEDSDEAFGDRAESYFDRDLRVAERLTVPGGAYVLDLRCELPTTFYRHEGLRNNLRCACFVFLRLFGRGPLFRMHLDSRNLADFDEAGLCRCYLRIAELLECMPAVRGVVGTSWFFDPAVAAISPNLAHLRQIPEAGGAFFREEGPGEIHTQRAIATSATRRRLYEEGRYKPTCVTLVWRRAALLDWARSHRAST